MSAGFIKKINRFLQDESGPTAVEYAVMLAMIIIAALGAVLGTGDVQKSLYQDTAQDLHDAMNPP